MNKYLKALIYSFGTLIVLTFIFNTLNYINLITGILFKIVKIIIPIITKDTLLFIENQHNFLKHSQSQHPYHNICIQQVFHQILHYFHF